MAPEDDEVGVLEEPDESLLTSDSVESGTRNGKNHTREIFLYLYHYM